MQRINVEKVCKKFRLGQKNQSALARVKSIFSGGKSREVWGLKNISFGLSEGEIVGIIGKNGSGKSSLLRVIAGIYQEDMGEITVNGKLLPLINLNIGMYPRLTMHDTIFLVGSLMDLGKKDIQQKFDSIVKFAELEEFIYTRIHKFSEGMKQRLAFSIAIHSNPDILLVDEVFEVGDEGFKERSVEAIHKMVREGMSVLLVSHDLDMVKKHCQRLILMDKGEIIREGKNDEIIEYYKLLVDKDT